MDLAGIQNVIRNFPNSGRPASGVARRAAGIERDFGPRRTYLLYGRDISRKGGNLNACFSINGLRSPAEVAAAWAGVEEFRRKGFTPETSAAAETQQQPAVVELDKATAGLAQRILKGLSWRPLGPRYTRMLQAWFDAPEGQAVKIEDLAKQIGANSHEMRASLSKLSGRMKGIATPEELANVRTPFLLLADIEYDSRNSSQHRLTSAGREAVRKYLGRREN